MPTVELILDGLCLSDWSRAVFFVCGGGGEGVVVVLDVHVVWQCDGKAATCPCCGALRYTLVLGLCTVQWRGDAMS